MPRLQGANDLAKTDRPSRPRQPEAAACARCVLTNPAAAKSLMTFVRWLREILNSAAISPVEKLILVHQWRIKRATSEHALAHEIPALKTR